MNLLRCTSENRKTKETKEIATTKREGIGRKNPRAIERKDVNRMECCGLEVKVLIAPFQHRY